jgi:hypothetical protein
VAQVRYISPHGVTGEKPDNHAKTGCADGDGNLLIYHGNPRTPELLQHSVLRFALKLRRLIAKSWILSRCYYPLHGHRVPGRAKDEIWYFAYGANMNDRAFRVRRGIRPFECRPGRVNGYRIRFNLEGRPKGKAAPANLCMDPSAEVWGCSTRSRGAI